MGSNFSKNNVNAKLNSKLNKWLTLDFNARLAYSVVDGLNSGGDTNDASASNSIINKAITYRPVEPLNASSDDDADESSNTDINPYDRMSGTYKQQRRFRQDYNAGLNWKPFKHFTFRSEFGYTWRYENTDQAWDKLATRNDNTGAGAPKSRFSRVDVRNWRNANTLTYDTKNAFAKGDRLNVLVGQEWSSSLQNDYYSSTINFPTDFSIGEVLAHQGAGEAQPNANRIGAKDNMASFFGRVNYTYADKYLLTATFRADGSSKFASGNRWGFFPAVALGWRISEEAFMKPLNSVLSNLKLRGSWGNIGNQSITPYAYIPGMDAEQAYWTVSGIKVTTLKPAALVSNSFTWEKVTTIDVGFDLGLLDNRLNMVFDWYRRDTKGMLAPGSELPGVLGASAPLQNTADLRSKGWEISVDWNDQIGKVKYSIGFNLYDAKTKITKYNNETGLFGKDKNDNETYRVGMELGEIWGYVTDRLYTVDDFDADGKLKPGIAKVEGYNPNPGDILYKDLDGNDIINSGTSTTKDPGDRKIIGNNTRRYQYGIHGSASWNGFSLSFLLQGVGKRDLWVMNDLFYPHYDAWTTVYDSQLNYWTPENTNSYFPRIYEKAAGNTDANTRVQTRYLQDGSYLSIRNITLSYNFPSKWMSKIGVNNLAVFFSGENLYTFDHLPKGLDPERSVTDDLGQRGFTYPYMRQYSFGINLSLIHI